MSRQIDKISLSEFKTICQKPNQKDKNQLEILAFELGLSKDEIIGAPMDELCKRIATNTVMAPTIIIPDEAEDHPREMFKLICDKFHDDYFLDEAYKWANKAGIPGIRNTMGKKELCNLLKPDNIIFPISIPSSGSVSIVPPSGLINLAPSKEKTQEISEYITNLINFQ